MGRVLRQVESARKKKQDTPLKNALFRRIGLKKQMGKRIYEALPEEGELGHVQTVQTTDPETEADTVAESLNHSDSTSQSLVIDTSFSSEEQHYPVDTSSSLPSPEVFRQEYVEQCTFRLDEDLTDLVFPIKNSTLLDLSHAETILMHQPPNLSTIMDAPTVLAENSPQEITTNRKPSDDCKLLKGQTTPALHTKKLIFLKKQVWFRSPLFSEKSQRESMASPKLKSDEIINQCHPPVPTSSPHQNIEADNEARSEEENKESDGGMFFDFASDSELDSFFCRMRERCLKLKNTAVFPLTAVRLKK